jgi:glycosyltransferase involved in cell wall biosynthesis
VRIGIDGRALASHMSGTGRYVAELMRGLDRELPDAEFAVYLRNESPVPAPSTRWTFRIDRTPWRRLPGPSWSRFAVQRMAKHDRLDVYWAAASIIPATLPHVPVVATVFDLNHLVFPASMPLATRFGHRWWFEASLRGSTRRVAISSGTARRVRDAFGIECEAIALPGVGAHFLDPVEVLRDDAVPDYVLSVATHEPRKNLGGLLRAMKLLNASRSTPVELRLVGAGGWGNAFDDDEKQILDAPWCHVLGYVSDADLPGLYMRARVFAFPSFYEGYGIPVAEARVLGVTVVTTDIAELREAAGPDAIYTGTSPQAIAEGLREGLSRQRPAASSSEATGVWTRSARMMAHELRQAAAEGQRINARR